MRAGGGCQGRGDGGVSPGLHKSKTRKVGETGSRALTAGGQSTRKNGVTREINSTGFVSRSVRPADRIDCSRPACLGRCSLPSLVHREPKNNGEGLSPGRVHGKAKLHSFRSHSIALRNRRADGPLTRVVSPTLAGA